MAFDNKLVIRRKKVRDNQDGTIDFNVNSVELNGVKVPFVTEASLTLKPQSITTVTLTIAVSDFTVIEE